MEIENKADVPIQYFKGSLIMGHWILFENKKACHPIHIRFDPRAADFLATWNSKGKVVSAPVGIEMTRRFAFLLLLAGLRLGWRARRVIWPPVRARLSLCKPGV